MGNVTVTLASQSLWVLLHTHTHTPHIYPTPSPSHTVLSRSSFNLHHAQVDPILVYIYMHVITAWWGWCPPCDSVIAASGSKVASSKGEKSGRGMYLVLITCISCAPPLYLEAHMDMHIQTHTRTHVDCMKVQKSYRHSAILLIFVIIILLHPKS